MYIKNGEIAEIHDVSERHVRATKKKYSEGRIEAIKPKKRGHSVEEKRILEGVLSHYERV